MFCMVFSFFAATSPLPSASDYVFAPFRDVNDATDFIDGRIMGKTGDYQILRAEDVAYLQEAWNERFYLQAGSMPVSVYNSTSNRVISRKSFQFAYGHQPDSMPGYVVAGPTFQTGLYEIENNGGIYLENRIAKIGGSWCSLTNVYWQASNTNKLEKATIKDRIVWHYSMLELAGRLVKTSLNRVDRTIGGIDYEYDDYLGYSNNGYPYSFDWQEYRDGPNQRELPYSGSDEYYCSVSYAKSADVSSVRHDSGDSVSWEYGLSPTGYYISRSEHVHTGMAARVVVDLSTTSQVVTTGGVTRIASIKAYIPLSVRYSRSKYVSPSGYGDEISTNFTARVVYAADATLDVSGANAKAVVAFDGRSVANRAMDALGVPPPSALSLSELPEPQIYDESYATSSSESRQVTVNVAGSCVVVLGCHFKTAPP